MTQDEKQLLLKDLCSRLPYNPKMKYAHYHKNGDDEDIVLNVYNAHKLLVGMDIYHIKPYLRPMSSMTAEEVNEYARAVCKFDKKIFGYKIKSNQIKFSISDGEIPKEIIFYFKQIYSIEHLDFILKHHFDYRGLIEKGLALEAPDGMYKID